MELERRQQEVEQRRLRPREECTLWALSAVAAVVAAVAAAAAAAAVAVAE